LLRVWVGRDFCNELVEDRLPERIEVLGDHDEGPRAANHIVSVIIFETAGALVCSALNDSGCSVRMTRPLMVTPLARASSRATLASRPELLFPSPEMSMVRRAAW
jgi:hypothetical protein